MAGKPHYLIDDATGKIVNLVVIELDDADPKYGWTPPQGYSVISVEDAKALDTDTDANGLVAERRIKAKDKAKAHKLTDRDHATLKAEADKKPKG